MSDREQRITVCAEWVVKAENDLTTAAYTLKLGASCPTDTVCFHSQQCVEKYLKALLVMEGIRFPKTHDLETIIARIPPELRPSELSSEEQAQLTDYAIGSRYPGWETISLAAARHAVTVARKVRREVRRRLPRRAVRRRRA